MSRSILSRLKQAYLLVAGARMCVVLVLQITYTHLFKLAKENPNDPVVRDKTQLVYNLLMHLGANLRSLNGAGAFAYAFYAYLIITFYVISPLFYAKHLNVDNNSFFTLLRNPQLSRKQTWDRLQECLEAVQWSRENYELSCGQNFRKFSLLGKRVLPQGARLEARQRLRSHGFKLKALFNTKLIWPASRTDGWRKTVGKILLGVYAIFMNIMWLLGHSTALMAHYMAHQAACRNELIPESWRHFTQLDLIALIDQFLLISLLQQQIAYPDALTIAIIFDQLKLLNQLKAQIGSYLTRSTAAGAFDCDKEALAIYINMAYYRRNLKPNLNFIGIAIGQLLTFAIAITLTLFSYVKSISQLELNIVAFLTVMSLSGLNLLFLSCAYFTAQSAHIVKHIGSLVGSSVALDYYKHSDMGEMLSSANNKPISEHTLSLWRRLVADQDKLVDSFTCKIYGGLLKINLLTVLRINFVCLSAVIFMLRM